MERRAMSLYYILILLGLSPSLNAQDVAGRRCDVPADVVFLMDSSDSIEAQQWEQEKDFVAELIGSLEVARNAIHVGVIVYSTDIGMVIDLQPFKTQDQVKQILRTATHLNGGTNTAKAIAKLIELSDSQGRIEQDAKQIAVIITDGRSTNVTATKTEAQRAREQYAIDVLAVGVGNETFREELDDLVGPANQGSLFQVGSFQQLSGVVKQLQDIICEFIPTSTTTTTPEPTTTTQPPPTTTFYIPPFPCSDPADVIVLIDGSYSIKPPDWVRGTQFVSYLINSLDIAPESVNVGLVVFGSVIGDVVPLQPYKNKQELRSLAQALVQPDVGMTNTAAGLRQVRAIMSSQSRPDVPHIAVLITDGESTDTDQTRRQASLAKAEGITIFVVGVGDDVGKQELQDVSSSVQTLFNAPDFTSLVSLVRQLRDTVCTVIKTTTPAPATTTTLPNIPALCLECMVDGGVGYNPMPDNCELYVMCIPQGLTYDPVVKTCPFGLFWSSDAVSCLDARYVRCPADRCSSMFTGNTYASVSGNCRSYFRCSNSRSSPMCCETDFRYVDGFGCTYDPTCRDPCPLEVTINNGGACMFRLDPESYYSYFEVIPGQGQVKRSCGPGQVYSDKNCSCTYDAASVIPELACVPLAKMAFDGTSRNLMQQQQPINVKGVVMTTGGSAYFDGKSYVSFPSTKNIDLGQKFAIKLNFTARREKRYKTWSDHGKWGFQTWYQNASKNGVTHTVIASNSSTIYKDTGRPKGASTKPLEVITVAKNGTVIRDRRYEVKVNTWPSTNQKRVTTLNLGDLANLSTPTMKSGIVYIPGAANRVLIQEPNEGVADWKIVTVSPDSRTSKVEMAGQGYVPLAIQSQYGFDLRAPLQERWWVLAPGGLVLQSGDGVMPTNVVNRYRAFTAGTLVKVFTRGDQSERWKISRPDGSQLEEGGGEIPKSLSDKYSINQFLGQRKVKATTWAVLSADGRIIEQGSGEIPTSTKSRYINDASASILKLTSQDGGAVYWELMRASGSKLLEGQGALPDGIASFVRGRLILPQVTRVREWTVTLPDGRVRSGTGDIPQDLLDLFNVTLTSGGNVVVPDQGINVIKQWTVTLPDGSVKRGYGVIPPDILYQLEKVTSGQQSRWEITLPNGSSRTGFGRLPSDLSTLNLDAGSLSGTNLVTGLNNIMRRSGRKRRQVMMGSNPRVMDVLSNCGTTQSSSPSLHLYTGSNDVSLTVVTSSRPAGVTLSLPVHDGLNSVMFTYDGQHLTGMVNGYVAKTPLTGFVTRKFPPLMLGQCVFRDQNHFVGEISHFEMYDCIP